MGGFGDWFNSLGRGLKTRPVCSFFKLGSRFQSAPLAWLFQAWVALSKRAPSCDKYFHAGRSFSPHLDWLVLKARKKLVTFEKWSNMLVRNDTEPQMIDTL